MNTQTKDLNALKIKLFIKLFINVFTLRIIIYKYDIIFNALGSFSIR